MQTSAVLVQLPHTSQGATRGALYLHILRCWLHELLQVGVVLIVQAALLVIEQQGSCWVRLEPSNLHSTIPCGTALPNLLRGVCTWLQER